MASKIFKDIYINDWYSVAGPREKEGSIKKFDFVYDDFYGNEKTLENMEIAMQKKVVDYLMNKRRVELLVGGDLLNQISATSYNVKNYPISYLGVYSACATFIESAIVLANMIESKFVNSGIIITSSHNLNSEKQYRFPIEYGAPKPMRSTFTSTGSVGAILSTTQSNIKIESATIGKVIDMGQKDVFNMGAVMAPSAAETIYNHMIELKRDISYYDLILTGDLGVVGANILKDYMMIKYNINLKKYLDAGSILYDLKKQNVGSGASGPAALPLVLFNKILKIKKYKKILVVGTASLHSPVMVNQKNSIPSVAHAISLEVS